MLNVPNHLLAEQGPSWLQESKRRVLRKLRRVQSLHELRRGGAQIGERVALERNAWIDDLFPWLVQIGSDCTFSFNTTVLTHDASPQAGTELTRLAPVTIGDHVFVGAYALILPGTKIGNDCIVGAGSVVGGVVPSGSVVVGAPARIVRTTADYMGRQLTLARTGGWWSADDLRREARSPARADELRQMMERNPGFVGSAEAVARRGSDRSGPT